MGGIAHCHGRAALETPEAELAAICDVSEDVFGPIRRCLSTFHVVTLILSACCARKISISWLSAPGAIPTPISASGPHGRNGVKAILCEKPISSTAAECEAMVKTAREHGVLLAEAFKFRHHPCHIKAKELIESGEIGNVKSDPEHLYRRRRPQVSETGPQLAVQPG